MEKINSIKLPDGVTYPIEDANALTKQQITNCLLEVPQDIKLELNDGVLTLKAGSKVIVPNGSGVFTEKVITSDMSRELNNANLMAFENGGGGLDFMLQNYCFSGTTAPTSFQDGLYAVWYDTVNNIVKRTGDAGATWTTGYSLPLFIADVNNNFQIFNGFGYIGSTVFVLPNVKGLIPNGRNEDGSLRNIEFTTTKVQANKIDANWTSQDWFIHSNGWLDWYPLQHGQIVYNEETNTWVNNFQGGINFWFPVGKTHSTGGKITSLTPKLPFRAVDYNNKAEVSGWSMPSNKYIDLALGASGSTYTAPANGWFSLQMFLKANANTSFGAQMTYHGTNMTVGGISHTPAQTQGEHRMIIPISKGEQVRVEYAYTSTYSGTLFSFHYAEGEV